MMVNRLRRSRATSNSALANGEEQRMNGHGKWTRKNMEITQHARYSVMVSMWTTARTNYITSECVPSALHPFDTGKSNDAKATRPAVEARTFRDHFPAHCTAFHIPWIPRRVYLWVPNEGAIHDMFYRCARPNDGRARVRVPSEEHQALFSMLGTKVPSYMVGQWVTVKKGTFAGDFGIVERIVHEGLAVELAVMARVDDSPEHSKSSRPMKRLATLLWLRQTFKTETIDHHEDGTYSFRKGRYRDGLHLLRLPIWRVQPAFPCLHDIHPFALKHLGELQDVECYVQVTDVVAVHSGPLRNLVGVVVERTGTEVLIRDVRRINFDNKNEEEDWIEGSTDIQDEKTYWDKLRDMRRTDVLWEIEHTPQDGRFDERCTTHIRSLRRFLDVGDEVLVKVGVHCGKIGIITGQHGDMIDIQTTRRILTDQDELQVRDPSHTSLFDRLMLF